MARAPWIADPMPGDPDEVKLKDKFRNRDNFQTGETVMKDIMALALKSQEIGRQEVYTEIRKIATEWDGLKGSTYGAAMSKVLCGMIEEIEQRLP